MRGVGYGEGGGRTIGPAAPFIYQGSEGSLMQLPLLLVRSPQGAGVTAQTSNLTTSLRFVAVALDLNQAFVLAHRQTYFFSVRWLDFQKINW